MLGTRKVNAKALSERLTQRQQKQLSEMLAEAILNTEVPEDDCEPELIECCPEDLYKEIKRNKKIWKSHAAQYQCFCALDVRCEYEAAGCYELYAKLKAVKKMQTAIALAHVHFSEYCYHECLVAGFEEEKEACITEICCNVDTYGPFEIEVQEWIDLIAPECKNCP